MEMRGIDPRTSRMLSERSTIWATSPSHWLISRRPNHLINKIQRPLSFESCLSVYVPLMILESRKNKIKGNLCFLCLTVWATKMLRKLLLQQTPTARRFLSAQTKTATLLNRCSAFSYSSSSSQSEIPQSNSIEQLEDQPTNTISIDRSGLYNPPSIFIIFSLTSLFLSLHFFVC